MIYTPPLPQKIWTVEDRKVLLTCGQLLKLIVLNDNRLWKKPL